VAVLVIGGTVNVGRQLVRDPTAERHAVRVVSRSAATAGLPPAWWQAEVVPA
jgi:hypothetical protein